jgi:hypothetical protein
MVVLDSLVVGHARVSGGLYALRTWPDMVNNVHWKVVEPRTAEKVLCHSVIEYRDALASSDHPSE